MAREQLDVRRLYEDLRKNFSLPDFGLLDKEFEISTIEKPDFLLRSIRRKIAEKLEHVAQVVDALIQPDTGSYASLTEYNALSEAERRDLLKHFQGVMALYRACVEAELCADDARDAGLIVRVAKEWPVLRKALHPFVKKIADSWTRSFSRNDVVGYFG